MEIWEHKTTLNLTVDPLDESELEEVKELAHRYELEFEPIRHEEEEGIRYNYETEESEQFVKEVVTLTIKKNNTNAFGKEKIHQNWDEFKKKLAEILPDSGIIAEPNSLINNQNIVETEFSGKNWTRIWFSKDPNICITQDNKSNIENFLMAYPDFKLTLIFDSQLLNEKGREHLQNTIDELTQKFPNRIVFSDFRSQDFQGKLQNDTERKLYDMAAQELNHIHKGGNVAAASDIVRIIAPSYQAGIYTDFDVSFTDQIYDSFNARSPLVFSMDKDLRCNDVMAIHPEASKHNNGELLAYQQQILLNYNQKNTEEECLNIAKETFEDSINPEIFEKKFKLTHDKLDPNIPPLFRLRQAFENICKTSPDLEFKKKCKDGLMKSVIDLTGPGHLPQGDCHSYNSGSVNRLSDIVKGQTAGIKNDASWFPNDSELNTKSVELSTPSKSLKEINCEAIKNIEQILIELKEKGKTKESGPSVNSSDSFKIR